MSITRWRAGQHCFLVSVTQTQRKITTTDMIDFTLARAASTKDLVRVRRRLWHIHRAARWSSEVRQRAGRRGSHWPAGRVVTQRGEAQARRHRAQLARRRQQDRRRSAVGRRQRRARHGGRGGALRLDNVQTRDGKVMRRVNPFVCRMSPSSRKGNGCTFKRVALNKIEYFIDPRGALANG